MTAPRGRDEVRSALVAAAAELFAERGVADVGTREIAAAAGVNRGLLHRHFGSKEALVSAVVADRAAAFSREVAADDAADLADFVGAAFDVGDDAGDVIRLLTRALLDGVSFEWDEDGLGLLGDLVDRMADEAGGESDTDPRLSAALMTATLVGWQLLSPVLLGAVGFERDPERARRELTEVAQLLARRTRSADSRP